jgi:large subunit ribosomal protein L4
VAPKASLLTGEGTPARELELDESVFGGEVKRHLVHETVRAEQAAQRAGTRALKSRGLVSGGRSKPWRQKGTGRARAGSSRAAHWTGGGAAFQPRTNFDLKVNRKVRRAAFRAALSAHAAAGTLGVLGGGEFDEPATRQAADLLGEWGKELPLLVVANADEEGLLKSFRNLDRVAVTVPAELDVADLVWARSLIISEAALPVVQGRAS